MKPIRMLFGAALCSLLLVQPVCVHATDRGDINADGAVNAGDAADILMFCAAQGAGEVSALDVSGYDINADTRIDAGDATDILQYAAYQGGGGRLSLERYLTADITTVDAVFLGVSNWGTVKFANAANFTYRFSVGGNETTYRLDNTPAGEQTYPIQNRLKVNYPFRLTLEDGTVTSAVELPTEQPAYTPPVSGVPGVHTLTNFLRTAMEPVGTTLYMFGGGWNWSDDGSAWSARHIGVHPDWVKFWQTHDQNYTYRDQYGNTANPTPKSSYYPYGGFNQYHYAGLDCSGFVSWTVYNTLHDVDNLPGYVGKSTQMARRFAGYGWGEWVHSFPRPDGTAATAFAPGDIMSESGHVWISLGTCSDGSIVIVHSTPSYSYAGQPGGGVQIGAVGNSTSCEAYKLASHYMTTYFPDWCARYQVTLKSPSEYLAVKAADCGRFRWSTAFLADPDGIQNMSAGDALKVMFGEN